MQSDSAVVSMILSPCSIASRWVSWGRKRASGSVSRVAVVHALDAVLRHQDRLRADLERTECACGVGREERVAGARGEQNHASLLEVSHGPPADVRLRDLRDGDRRLDTCVGAEPLEGVLEREGVQERGQHPGIVGGRTVHPLGCGLHAAVEVSAADDDRELRAGAPHRDDLACDRDHGVGIDPVLAVSHQRLARELEQHAAEGAVRCSRSP